MSCYQVTIQDGRKVCRPVTDREEYLALRGSKANVSNRIMAQLGNTEAKRNLVQMNYSCLPNEDGTLKGTTRMSTTVGMDIDHLPWAQMQPVREHILQKKDELGLLMLEMSASSSKERGEGGYHLVFRRRPDLLQEGNLKWASDLLGVKYDSGAKDITRVFFTTTASEEDLIWLDDQLFELAEVKEVKGVKDDSSAAEQKVSPKGGNCPLVGEQLGSESDGGPKGLEGASPLPLREGRGGSGAEGGSFPDSYQGIPYAVICNSLLAGFGFKDGIVPEGARNTTLYRLARQLRYICDFNPRYVRACIPTWGLGEEEAMQTIQSAVSSTRATDIPSTLKQAINEIQKPDLSTPQKRQEYLQRLNPMPRKMPWLLRYINKRYGRNGRSALVAALPMLGTLLGRFESKYLDGRRHRPVFMVVVAGHAGCGKGFIDDLQEWLLRPILEEDEKGRKQLEAYAREREKKKGAKQLPDKPTPCIRILSATSSNGKLLEVAENALGQPLCVITEEIDESRRANRNGAWADKSDIYRKAFDGSIWGQDYLTYSGSVRIYINLVFAGTYLSVRNYFQNVENGLMTRFFFTEMARDLGHNVEVRSGSETKDDRKAAEIVGQLYEMGSTTEIPEEENIIQFALPKAKKAAFDFNEEKIAEWRESGPDEDHRDMAIDLLRRRAAVTIFRASQIMYALEGMKETQAGQDMARWYGNEAYLNQYIMFADQINAAASTNDAVARKQDIAASRLARANALFRLLDALPKEFTRDDVSKALEAEGKSLSGMRQYISRLLQREMIMEIPGGYKKLL